MNRPPVLVLSLVAFALLTGCGDGGEGEQARPAGASSDFCQRALAQVDSFMEAQPEVERGERYGGTAVVGGIGEIADGMNGLVSADYSASQHQAFMNLMTLIQYDENLEPRPYLAESWELSDDGTELTFHLRDDVMWHDGERTDAYDVAFTYLRATDPATGFPNATFWTYYESGEEGVEVVDSLTVRFDLEPHAQPLDPWRATAIMPEHLLGDVPPAELRQHPYGTGCPVGNGPFVFEEHRQDASWTFSANPAFPEALGGRPYLDRYVYRIIPEETTLLTDLLTGGVDVQIGVRPDQADRVEGAEELDLRNYEFRNYTYAGWNSRLPQLAEPEVRRAITMATNRREIVDAILQGYGSVANTSVPPFHWAYDPSFEDALPYDPDQARRLLDEAGWIDRDGDGVRENEDGTPMEIVLEYNTGNQSRQDIAEIMQAQLRQVGIRIVPRSVEWATLISDLTDTEERPIEGVILSWVVEFKLDDTDLFHSESSSAPYGFAGTEVEEIDELLDTLPLITDPEEARPYWLRYQELIIEHQPYTFFYYPERLTGVHRRLQDVTMDVRGEWVNIGEWWIPPEERRYADSDPPR